jgi:hypothetical protein
VFALPNGGVTFFDSSLPVYAPFPIFVITIKEGTPEVIKSTEDQHELLLGLTAYLKSSFVLWYITTIHQKTDLSRLLIGGNGLPLPRDLSLFRQLASFGAAVHASERALLKEVEQKAAPSSDRGGLNSLISEHNKSVLRNMRNIDREVFRYLGFCEKDTREVYRVLKQLNIFDFNIASDMDGFVAEVKQ